MQHLFQRRITLVILLGVAMALRVVAGVWWQERLEDGKQFGFADSQSYWYLAQTIVRGQPYQFGDGDKKVFRAPGYPLLLAGLFCLVGDDPPVVWARVQSALFGVMAVAGVIFLCRQLFDESAALTAGAMAVIYPGAIAMSTFVLSEGAFCPLMLVQLICWTAACRAESRRQWVLLALVAGMAAGAATLVRPSWLLFTPGAIVLALLVTRQRTKQTLIGLAMVAGLILVMAPWWVRNYQITGRFVPTTLQVGASLYDGLSPRATGASEMSFVAEFETAQRAEDAATPNPVGVYEDRLDSRMRREATHWARNHPRQVVQLIGVKLLRMWNVWPNAVEMQSWPQRFIIMLGYLPLLIAGLWGAWKYSKRGWPYAICLAPAVYFTLLHVVFVSSIRYRQPAMLPLIVLAGGVIGPIISRIRLSRTK